MRFQRKLGGAKPPAPAPRKGNPLSPMSTERNSLERTRKAYFDGSDVDPPLPPPHQMARKRRFHLANASAPSPVDLAGDPLLSLPAVDNGHRGLGRLLVHPADTLNTTGTGSTSTSGGLSGPKTEGGGRHRPAFVPLRPSPLTVYYLPLCSQSLVSGALRPPSWCCSPFRTTCPPPACIRARCPWKGNHHVGG